MKSYREAIVRTSAPIRDVIASIDRGSMQIALVVDEGGRLRGTVTDGDVRRGVLKGLSLDDSVEKIMRRKFICVKPGFSRAHLKEIFSEKGIHQIPVVDEEGRVVGMELVDDYVLSRPRENPVVLMAGGEGSRLSPLTDQCPKPLLPVGQKPILETILENFLEHGFRSFYISVNYKKEMIHSYFGNGSRWGVEIAYLHEEERLGTAGSLSLIPQRPRVPLIVMNADLLTKVNFTQLLNFHSENGAGATLCIRECDFQMPYGVVRLEENRVLGIDEKPVKRFYVNGGIYVFNPEVLDVIAKNERLDMPQLFEALVRRRWNVVAFPIREYWIDVGRLHDLEQAHGDFPAVFE